MKTILLVSSLFLLSRCSSFESHVREMQNKNIKTRVAEQRVVLQKVRQKIKEKCTSLGLKIGTTEHNVCVDRKIDNVNLAIGISNGMAQIERSSKARDNQIKSDIFWKNHAKNAGKIISKQAK